MVINVSGFAKMIVNMVIYYHGLLNSIISDCVSVFISKFWLLLCYFLAIKQKLSIAFHPQTDGQTKRHNSIREVYL